MVSEYAYRQGYARTTSACIQLSSVRDPAAPRVTPRLLTNSRALARKADPRKNGLENNNHLANVS
jgi:hypothetical protein